MSRWTRRAAMGVLALTGAYAAYAYVTGRRGKDVADALYSNPLPRPEGSLSVYHLGHSLVGRDMPAMLAQLAGDGHEYDSQLGWGTSLKEHWEPDLPVNGFEQENDRPRFRAAKEALQSGGYDAVVLTEMVEIADAVRYHDSAEYLARWAGLAWDANPKARIYLYETWHHTNDNAGWLERIDSDLRTYWQGRVIYPALAAGDAPIHLIPAGQVKAAFVRSIEERGGVAEVQGVNDLFAKRDDGTPDTIHFNDLGAYLVALTHYAVLYHRSPIGLPNVLMRADGTPATAPSPQVAGLMQQIVWDVVRAHPETGVAA
ncbi:hypothetical protein Z946_3361 [Sulfitobacter noctilucicola]|uniref:SGNH/GDSL hydrolase family protein n=1 Tax=Sulfitobacter noctilucicola TaxID=1342301 RepID=A0A7W6Q621_9RHOB|nr:hypothetical protein [Sulfitobacter noctilucicola]KIN64470.1 hypothetical protein Z946_3361 [Sulfitobacter noctilucicola]MBB4174370.1 hypothetical protein [Sulfitobacter noctilucicola]